ncbi:MAG: hypothetical protein KF760_04060 [Candidatus Eremiobacteraeota bacterium]|nr:hypothetical protein [Candidatus Eremiobacteraeota bacterium]MCW5872478.1 hypothetical protein [Candidatus Eremiobacteraeota bacterium]
MKKLLFSALLSGACWAHPLSWLAGTYHGAHDGATLEETWTDTGRELLGTTVWLEEGRISLRELMRIRPQQGAYHLDLWLTFADGRGKHLEMNGRLEGANQLVFRRQRNGRPESLTFLGQGGGGVKVELQKQELTAFELAPGPTPETSRVQAQTHYVLHTYLGDQVFADELYWSTDHTGSLVVPGKFQSVLENVKPIPGGTSFEIMVPEGKEPYRVRYLMRFNADLSQATGSLVKVSTGQTIGSFVAVKRN